MRRGLAVISAGEAPIPGSWCPFAPVPKGGGHQNPPLRGPLGIDGPSLTLG
jgi:hypothetical protein